MDHFKAIQKAYHRIGPHIYKTPLVEDILLSQMTQGQIFRKQENWQVSGSFKIRGVMNKILSMSPKERKSRHFVAASTGNHAAAFGHTLRKFNLTGEVFVPEHVNSAKRRMIDALGVRYKLVGKTSLQTEISARQYADEHGYCLVHPYNDWDIVHGQGTIAFEILEEKSDISTIVVPVGGGGMISGISLYAKRHNPDIRIIGVQPERSPEMFQSLKQKRIIEEDISLPTLSDGTAGGIEPGAITFDICSKHVDDMYLLSEEEIGKAMVWALEHHQLVIEGAAALSIALSMKHPELFKGRKSALILCGSRVDYSKLKSLILKESQ